MSNIDSQLQMYPQEKIYLQCDKSDYISGEKIFFRIYKVDAVTNKSSYLSRYVYVELNSNDSTVCRVKIKPDEKNDFYGYLQIPANLNSDKYFIRAYTRYMCNFGASYFYNKKITVFNPKNKQANREKPNKLDYDVKFFPEGGYLIDGKLCTVAFKAVNETGYHEDIQGTLTDENGEVINSITSIHDGMGMFGFIPSSEKKYYINCTDKNEKNKRFCLPQARNDTYSLNIKSSESRLSVSILKPIGQIVKEDSLLLLLHSGGIVQYKSWISKEESQIVFDKNKFPTGIMQVLLLDKSLSPVSERLVFINNNDYAKIAVESDKREYAKRSHVLVTTKISNKENLAGGSYSVSVTDGNDISPDTTTSILTAILLTSELKGYIENPGYYFSDNKEAFKVLDLLMMTQGWRRYDIPEVLKGNITIPQIQPERSQKIYGIAKHDNVFKNTALKDGNIMLFIPKIGFVEEAMPDQKGHFVFDSFEFPDSLKYIVQAVTKKGKNSVELSLAEDTFPKIQPYLINYIEDRETDAKNTFIVSSDYVLKADRQYVMENGIRTIELGEVGVTAKKITKKSIYASTLYRTLDRNYIEKNHIIDTKELVRKIPGVNIINGQIFIRGGEMLGFKKYCALIIVDDMIMSEPDSMNDGTPGSFSINDINIDDIETIYIVHASESVLLGSRGIGGAVVITTRKDKVQNIEPYNPNIKVLRPLGYQKPVEFYSPKYETKEEKANPNPDLRTTIYWKPNVTISDDGEAKFDFYTADAPSTYNIVIEGVTGNGELIHDISTIKIGEK